MKTLKDEIRFAKEELLNHKVIAFPTETVMGLGIIYNDIEAYNLLNAIKRRPEDKPYTMMIGDPSKIKEYAYIDERIERVIKHFLPGSLTLLLKGKENLPYHVSHGSGVIGIRVPSNKEALELLKEVNVPLLVPSANVSGQSPALSSDEVRTIFSDKIKAIISGKSISNTPSTIIDFTNDEPILIREGTIKFSDVLEVFHV